MVKALRLWWHQLHKASKLLFGKRRRSIMPKFYHGEQLGFGYNTRAVGIRRVFPFNLFPYFNGDIIQIRLSLKSLFEQKEWQAGILQIEPPGLHKWNDKWQIRLSDYPFAFVEYWRGGSAPKYKFLKNKWWSRILPLKGGISFDEGSFKVNLIFQNIDGEKVEQSPTIHLADIEVVSRGPFQSQLFMWLTGLIGAGLIGYWVACLTG
jgi:hypothetical protein